MDKECEICGNRFFRPKKYSDPQWEKRKFCSKKCSGMRLKFNETDLINSYINDKKSSNDIAKELGTNGCAILRILHRNNITIRPASENKILALSKQEVRKKMSDAKIGKKLSEKTKEKLRQLVGHKSKTWSGGLTVSATGYLQFTKSPANGVHAGKLLHKVIAEWLYQRKLKTGEHVHHIDRVKMNNNPDNLIIMTGSDHAKIHTKDRENGK